MKDIDKLAEDMFRAVKGYCDKEVDLRVAKHLGQIELRLREIEEKSPFNYLGVHERDKAYEKGNFVTFQGSVWHCKRDTRQAPGDSDAWNLAVKQGRPGKDAL